MKANTIDIWRKDSECLIDRCNNLLSDVMEYMYRGDAFSSLGPPEKAVLIFRGMMPESS